MYRPSTPFVDRANANKPKILRTEASKICLKNPELVEPFRKVLR